MVVTNSIHEHIGTSLHTPCYLVVPKLLIRVDALLIFAKALGGVWCLSRILGRVSLVNDLASCLSSVESETCLQSICDFLRERIVFLVQ